MFSQYFVDAFNFFYLANGIDANCTQAPDFLYFLNQSNALLTPIANPNSTAQPFLLYQYACNCTDATQSNYLNLYQIGNSSSSPLNENLKAIFQGMEQICNQSIKVPAQNDYTNLALTLTGLGVACVLAALLIYRLRKTDAAKPSRNDFKGYASLQQPSLKRSGPAQTGLYGSFL